MKWNIENASHPSRDRGQPCRLAGRRCQTPLAADAKTIEGVWIVQVSQRDCATQALRGTFSSLVTFVNGGTMYESPGGVAFAAGQRSTGHGTWTRMGDSTFRQRIVAQILFGTPPALPVSPGFEAGWQVIDHTVTLSDPDHATSAAWTSTDRTASCTIRLLDGCAAAVRVINH